MQLADWASNCLPKDSERAALVGATLAIESSSGRGTTILVRMAVGAGELHHA